MSGPGQHPAIRLLKSGTKFLLSGIVVLLIGTVLLLRSCADTAPRVAVPAALASTASVPGFDNIRYWADDALTIGQQEATIRAQQLQADGNTSHREFLAISGGGPNGAFGAGVLVGWTKSGLRPEFETVTGVSTGSLSAPFAFLGTPYDQRLHDSYTKVSGENIYAGRNLLEIFGIGAAVDNTPLRRLVEDYVTDEMVTAIAREHLRGRRLFVLTTNLDAGRPVAWNIGAIAISDHPGRKDLIRDLLIASAAIPGVFPPVRIKVVADGVTYEEMHVDGSTAKSAFFVPRNFANAVGVTRGAGESTNTLYVIRNGRVVEDYTETSGNIAGILRRSISVALSNAAIDNLYELKETADSIGFSFNAVWIPDSFTMKQPAPFDPDYMRALYEVGYQIGAAGDFWSPDPP